MIIHFNQHLKSLIFWRLALKDTVLVCLGTKWYELNIINIILIFTQSAVSTHRIGELGLVISEHYVDFFEIKLFN